MITRAIIHTLNILLLFGNGFLVTASLSNLVIKEVPNGSKLSIETSFADFTSFVRLSDLFVDKTTIIKNFLNFYQGETILVSCPRHMGKTLTLDTIATFLSMKVDDNGNMSPVEDTLNYRLFSEGEYLAKDQQTMKKLKHPLAISKERYLLNEYLGRRPVIRLNLGMLEGGTFKNFIRTLRIALSDAYKPHKYMLTVLQKREAREKENPSIRDEKYYFKRFLEGKEEFENKLIDSLRFLSEILRSHFSQRVYIFVDEYDTAYNEFFLNSETTKEDKDKFVMFFKNFITSSFKFNDHMTSSFLTGTTAVIDDSIFNQNSRIKWYDCKGKDFHQYYGFSEQELNLLFETTGISGNERQEAVRWYNGYLFGDDMEVKIANPTSIAHFINSRKFDCYWTDKKAIDTTFEASLRNAIFRDKISDLVYNNTVEVLLNKSKFFVEDYEPLNDFSESFGNTFRYLYAHGYLEVQDLHPDLDDVYLMKLTNFEIVTTISRKIEHFYNDAFQLHDDDFSIYSNMLKDYVLFLFDKNTSSRELTKALEQYLKNLPKFVQSIISFSSEDMLEENESALHMLIGFLTFKLKSRQTGSEIFIKRVDPPAWAFLRKRKLAVLELNSNISQINDALANTQKYTKYFEGNFTVIKHIGITVRKDKTVFIEAVIKKL